MKKPRIFRSWMLLLGLTLLLLDSCTGQSRLVSGERELVVRESLQYYLYYPPGYDSKNKEGYGLLLFLHGGGESGRDLNLLTKQGPPRRLLVGPDLPYLVLAPQHPDPRKWWNTRAVKQLLDQVVSSNRIDPNRIYLSGLSRGGFACWELAVQYPGTFAAMAIVCGMAPEPYAHWIDTELPIWVFHGTDDPVIPFSESQNMVRALRKQGMDVRFTAYEGVGHNAWDRAYANEELYSWFADQRRTNKAKAPEEH